MAKYDFHPFSKAVAKRFEKLSKNELFVAGDGSDDIFAHYLASFPEGTNPIFKTRTEFDCSCCKNFVRNIGRLVCINGSEVETVWGDIKVEYPFNEVTQAMDKYVKSLPISSLYRTRESKYGNEVTRSIINERVVEWNHFYGAISNMHKSIRPEEVKGEYNSTVHVFKRGLEELKPAAISQVIDLIQSNSLYRGQEHLTQVLKFQNVQATYLRLNSDQARTLFVFSKATDPACRFRNTVIGTLVQDLSNNVDLEEAVRMFEIKVAPHNYKRTTALITPRMIDSALAEVRELGLESALERRLAKISDVSVNNVLWVDRSFKNQMKGGSLESLLKASVKVSPKENKADDISIDEFMEKVLPKAQSLELCVKNGQTGNFMALTAPVHEDAGQLFRWNNNFAWSYDGNITDSIKERVKAAGGNVNARLRFSLAWFNRDDLDIHVKIPNGEQIYFGNKAGILDVDMNAFGKFSTTPVENLAFTHPADGKYIVWVNQFCKRDSSDVGFSVEVSSEAGVTQLSYKRDVRQSENILVGTFLVKNGKIIESVYGKDLLNGSIPLEKWGIKTEQMVKVKTVMLSPNYWDNNAVGNKHYFFLLDGCKTDTPMRGIYTEFLQPQLEKHRKVFEVLGDKTKCPAVEDQLSGVGFSTTRQEKVLVSVQTEKSNRMFNINFGKGE
jgi:hypothetical protein